MKAFVATRAFPIDYDADEVSGNSIKTAEDSEFSQFNPVSDYQDVNDVNDVSKREPEIFQGSQKRNIISALRAKMRRSNPNDVEDKLRFSPVLSVGEFD